MKLTITKQTKVWQYASHLFVSIDQLGNALASGNADNTISARVGYYNHHYSFENGKVPWYWVVFQKIIDNAFCPVDGPGHCHEAYHNDAGEIFDNRRTNFMVAIAAAIVIPSCAAFALVLYPLSFLGIVKRKTIHRDKNLVKRFRSCSRSLTSTLQEIEEHKLSFDLDQSKKQLKELSLKVEEIKRKLCVE